MAQLVFEIKNQWISRTDTFKPVAKSKNYLYAQFNFLTDEWVGVPTAIFRNKTSAYEQIIGQDGTCLVPWEVIDVEGDSEIFVSVFCGDLVTANKARVHVYDTGYGDDLESSTPPTPSVYEQILNRMDDIEEDMDDATRRAETAAENAEEASAHYPVILEDYWYVWDVTEREYVNTDIKAEGHDGTSATVEVVQVVGGHRIVITDVSGEHVFDVPDGHDGTDGRGIASLEKTSTSGDVDQYTMTFSDGSEPFVYYVTNGASATISTRAITNGYRLTITDKNGTRAIDVLNGAKGDPGNGIQSINKIGSYENYDYYEIRMTNGNKTSFTVTNGYSPTVEIVNITGGHRVVITDTNGAHSFDVMDGEGGGGVAIHICSSSEYDHTTGVPTIQNPEENTFYLVPSSESATHDMFAEWVYVNNAWEMFGSASIDLSNYATKTDLNTKVDKVAGKGLSTNDYTTEEKNKLSGIEAQANKTVVDDVLSSTSTNPVQNKKVKEALDNLDAGDIAYDDAETYSNGTIGKGLSSVKAEINQLNVDLEEVYIGKEMPGSSVNKLNTNEILSDTLINRTGVETEDNRYYSSGYIATETTGSVAFTGLNSAGTKRVCLPVARVLFYNSEKSVISYVDGVSSNTITPIPSNVEYIRMSWDVAYNVRQLMIELVNNITDISPEFVEYQQGGGERTHGINYLDETQQDILERVTQLETDISVLGTLSDNVDDNTLAINNILGISNDISSLATFAHGSVNSTTGAYISDDYDYRCATPQKTTITQDYTFTIANGFRLYLFYFDESGNKISSGWVQGAQLIVSGSILRMIIARTTEDSSESADIATFCSKVNYETIYNLSSAINADSIIPYGCTWDWWISANSVDAFGNAYIGYIDSNGYHGVLRKQSDGTMQYKRLELAENDDDHNGTATIVLNDGKVLAIGAYGHSKNEHVVCWKSTESYSISNMEKFSFDIAEADWNYACTYSQIFQYGGILYDFMRCVCTKSGETTVTGYICLKSTDAGETWTPYKAIEAEDPYIAFAQASDDDKILKAVIAHNPGAVPGVMKGFTFDMNTEKFYNLSGTEIGHLVSLNGGTIADVDIAHYADMTDLIQQGTTSNRVRLFTAASVPKATTAFLYAQATDSTMTDFIYYLYNNGTSVEIGHSGVPFGGTHYISGICFGSDINTIYYSKATTAKADGAHELHKVKISNNTVESDDIITEASMCILRPLFLGNGELATVVGHYNDQNSDGTYNNSYTAWELKPLFTHA